MQVFEYPEINPLSLNSLPSEEISKFPAFQVVYFVIDQSNNIIYIGATSNLYARWYGHKLRKASNLRVAWLEWKDTKSLLSFETYLINRFKPPFNRIYPNNTANEFSKFLTTENEAIELDTSDFCNWLKNNESFKFVSGIGGTHSYRARKEKGNYWYAIKKVNGKIHKQFIGKSEQVTHSRLLEVAQTILQPPKPRHKADPEVAMHSSGDLAEIWEAIRQLREEINQLSGKQPVYKL